MSIKDRLECVVVVFRHGARAPSTNALEAVLVKGSEGRSEWAEDEVENLTAVGKRHSHRQTPTRTRSRIHAASHPLHTPPLKRMQAHHRPPHTLIS